MKKIIASIIIIGIFIGPMLSIKAANSCTNIDCGPNKICKSSGAETYNCIDKPAASKCVSPQTECGSSCCEENQTCNSSKVCIITSIKPDTNGSIITNQPTTKATCDVQKWNRDPTSQICCKSTETYDATTKWCISKTTTAAPAGSINWITINEECLTNGQCKFNIYDTLGIRKSIRAEGDPTSVGIFVQDIVLSATFFIWTVVTVALIVSGLMYIFAAASGNDPKKAKDWIIWALIWLVIVACSYFIIRLVQYLAKGV